MRIHRLLYILFLVHFISQARADHIVGGEILIEHLIDYDYRIRVNIYRDGSGILPPLVANVEVFERGTGGLNPYLQKVIVAPLISDTQVPSYTPDCTNTLINIERWYYEVDITLDPDSFSHPSGYLFVWRDCCRNQNLTNIISPLSTGQAIMTLFPPIRDVAGSQVINSTPNLSFPVSEYGCVGQLFYMDFGGSDPDGDSLAFEMFAPRTYGAVIGGTVSPQHDPYADPLTMTPSIIWVPTFSEDDAIHGFSGPPDPAPDRLQVDEKTGMLRVTPRDPGLHLYGIVCKEYRDINGDGEKEIIGSVYRDYQLPIVSGCSFPDTLDGPVPVNTGTDPGDTIIVPGIANQREVCFKVWDSDYSSANPIGMHATFQVHPQNFPDGFIEYSPKDYTFSSESDTATICIKFLGCAKSEDGPLRLTIITTKGNCPLPYQDSTDWFFEVEELPYNPSDVEVETFNYDPNYIQFPPFDLGNPQDTFVSFQIRPQWEIEIDFLTIDSTNDTVVQFLQGDGFHAINSGMQLYNQKHSDTIRGSDTLRARFRWNPGCKFFQIGKGVVNLVTMDRFCNEAINIRPIHFEIIKTNELPILTPKEVLFDSSQYKFHDFDPVSQPDTFMTFEISTSQEIEFTLLTVDSAADSIVQYLEGVDFNPSAVGMQFFNANQNKILVAEDSLTATFKWKPRCEFFEAGGGQVNLITDDRFCEGRTIVRPIFFKIIPDNTLADVSATSVDFPENRYSFPESDSSSNNDTFMVFEIRPKWTIELDLQTLDPDEDSLEQYIRGVGFDSKELGMEFFNNSHRDTLIGMGRLLSTFKWTPDCEFFGPGGGEFQLVTREKHCGKDVSTRRIFFEILTDNQAPKIVGQIGNHPQRTEASVTPKDQYFNKQVGESLVFDYWSSDGDADQLYIYYKYEDLDPSQTFQYLNQLGIDIGNRLSNPGDSALSSTFFWSSNNIDCEAFERFNENTPLEIMVFAVDSSCLSERDSSLLTIEINDGEGPYFKVRDDRGLEREISNNEVTINSKASEIRFSVIARDDDELNIGAGETRYDEVKMTFEPHRFSFEEKDIYTEPFHIPIYVERSDSVDFVWEPKCEDRNSDPLKINFLAEDRSCQGFTERLYVWLEAETELGFPNIITPNGDGANDYLELFNSGQYCGFEGIRVFNRWGAQVFSSNDKNFQFGAEQLPAGDYYYSIRFESKTVTQTLTVIK